MRYRELAGSGQLISEIGFGCGNVGGLIIRGERAERIRAVARAIELGITYFDTAAQYGDGVSEKNLGEALAALKADVLVGTKINVSQADLQAGHTRIEALFDAGLKRLGRERVDILYYHGRILRAADGNRGLTPTEALGPLLESFRRFREAGKVRFLAFTGLGDSDAVLEMMRPNAFDCFHCYFSAVNPTAAYPAPPTWEPQNMRQMLVRAREAGMSGLGIRILAAGALAGDVPRHPLASPAGGMLTANTEYAADVARAERLRPIARELGISLPELGIRFALSQPELACGLVGVSSLDHVETAVAAANAGPLPEDVLQRIVATTFAGA